MNTLRSVIIQNEDEKNADKEIGVETVNTIIYSVTNELEYTAHSLKTND